MCVTSLALVAAGAKGASETSSPVGTSASPPRLLRSVANRRVSPSSVMRLLQQSPSVDPPVTKQDQSGKDSSLQQTVAMSVIRPSIPSLEALKASMNRVRSFERSPSYTGYRPSDSDVVISKHTAFKAHPGNLKLQKYVAYMLRSKCPSMKGFTLPEVQKVVKIVEGYGGRFVALNKVKTSSSGSWKKATDFQVVSKVRNTLHLVLAAQKKATTNKSLSL